MIRTLTAALVASLVLACGGGPYFPGGTPDHEAVPDYPTLLADHCADTGFLVDVADDQSVVWIDCGERVEEMTIGTQVRIVEAVLAQRSRQRQLLIDAFKDNGRKE